MADSINRIQQVDVGGILYDIYDSTALHSISDAHGQQGPQSAEGLYTIQTDEYGHTKTVHNVIGTHTGGDKDYAVQLDSNKVAYVNVDWKDEHVSSATNHYTPALGPQSWLVATPKTGTKVEWANPVVTGVHVNQDTKGHITGVQVVTGTLPDTPPNDNTWRPVQVNNEQKQDSTTTDGALNIKDGTHTTVSYNNGVIVSHNNPGTPTLSAETIQGTVGNWALNAEYTVVTGVQIAKDSLGHVTGVQVTKQKVKDTHPDAYTADYGIQVNGHQFTHTNSVPAQTTLDLYKVTHDESGHITGSTAVTNGDIISYITQAGADVTGLQTTVQHLIAELNNPDDTGGLVKSFLDTAKTMLNAKDNAVTGVQEQLYGFQVNDSVLSLVFDGTKVNTKRFVTG